MSEAVRVRLFLAAAAGLAVVLAVGLGGLTPFGQRVAAYGEHFARVAVSQRHTTDIVSAITFDYRGIDTLFEEFMLFAAVTGISVLLRPLADERRNAPEDQAPDRHIPPPSPTVGLLGVILCTVLVVFGVETITHGQVSPGGGFQGGVIAASAIFVLYLATDYRTIDRYKPGALLEAADGAGAWGYAAVGLAGLATGGAFLLNVIPLGTPGMLWSGGTIFVINLTAGLEVAGAFVLLVSEFLDQTEVVRGSNER